MTVADIIIENGNLITFGGGTGRAEAIALAGGHILAVGTNAAVRETKGPDTRVIDAQNGTVLPGFIESHIHLFSGGLELGMLDLSTSHDPATVTAKVQEYAAQQPDAPVLYAIGAHYDLLGAGRSIDRHGLDRVIADRPFAVMAADHHTLWANTRALALAGILQGGNVPEGSEIVMGEDGLATGELLESGAYEYVLAETASGGRDLLGMTTGNDPVPPATAGQRAADKACLRAGLQHLAKTGVTTFHNMDGNFYQLELLSEIEAEGDLLCRGQIPFHLKNYDPIDRLNEADEMRRRYDTDWLWSGRLKLFHDGVVESGTAAMLRPYPNWPDSTGAPLFEPDQFNEICVRADAMGLQICVHAIGDAAVRGTLDGYAAARAANGSRDGRHRIEHIEVLHPDDLPRLRELDVVASVQPLHAPWGGLFPPPAEGQILHEDQKPLSYACQTIRETGVPMIFSSDWPVVPVEVLPSIGAAVAPMSLGGNWTDQRQSLHDALESYTAMGAYAEFNESKKGGLVPGMFADLVILSGDLDKVAPEDVGSTSVRLTICGGRVTYDADANWDARQGQF
ncbi:amidohydrolase [Sedimentitalea todarodis]|uniref:Amidohydrolase n=1 Tax=Sedimentitalea todarodis TaxID=1631240 RepID=A0ABU3VBJ3_9RHOB|nr:amidohydrolase [Sedimentitalea todarodis]MDU9003548.1 amidohydrolase [Sedimentitalea todarodis]